MEVPVYLFTGFLGAGKTTFIQDALSDEGFNDEERTLLLLCEEGEVEYRPSDFYNDDVYIERISEPSMLKSETLARFRAECEATRVVIEWNGMWELSGLFENMPDSWVIVQQMMLAEASTFLMFNTNLRQQTFEQMKGAELVAFNRCVRDEDFRPWQLEVYKICRVASRSSQIVYEFGDEDVLLDDIPDPLPYDMEKDLLEITERDFAEWYRDMGENQDDYEGKEIVVKGRAIVGGNLPPGKFIFGRHVMTCCEADIEFAGLLCLWDWEEIEKLSNGQWVEIRGKATVAYDEIYGEAGPVIRCSSVTLCEPCDPEVATF